jgi:hypothetical protein
VDLVPRSRPLFPPIRLPPMHPLGLVIVEKLNGRDRTQAADFAM